MENACWEVGNVVLEALDLITDQTLNFFMDLKAIAQVSATKVTLQNKWLEIIKDYNCSASIVIIWTYFINGNTCLMHRLAYAGYGWA